MGPFIYVTTTVCIDNAINRMSSCRTGGEKDKMRSVNKLFECN
jgi:hypothetical protein